MSGKDWRRTVYKKQTLEFDADEWGVIRERILTRDRRTCCLCRKKPRPGTLEFDTLDAHHLTPRSHGGGHEDWNLITLCVHCHNDVETLDFTTAAEFYRYRRLEFNGGEEYEVDNEEPEELPSNSVPWQARVYGGSRA